MIEQQLQLQCVLVEVGAGQGLGALAQGGPGDGQGIDRIGLAARPARRGGIRPSASAGTRTTRSPAATRKRSKEPETWRQSSSAQMRSSSRPRPQSSNLGKARLAGRALSAHRRAAPLPANTAAAGVGGLVGVRSDHDHVGASLRFGRCLRTDLRLTNLTWGDCHAPIKSSRGSLGGGGRHNQWKSVLLGRHAILGVSSPPSKNQPAWSDANRRPWADD